MSHKGDLKMKFDPILRDFTFTADERADLNLQAADWDANQQWSVMGEAIGRMIMLRHPYQSWVTRFFETSSIPEVLPYPTIAVEDYVGTSVEGSPFQTPRYIRPTFQWKHSTNYWAGGAAYYHMNDTKVRGWDPLSRVAAQINVFAIGFPITLGVGLIGMLLTLPMLQRPFTLALERMLAYF